MSADLVAAHLQTCLPRLAPLLLPSLPISELALDSMDTVELLCVIHEEFGVRLSEAEFFPAQTIGGLCAAIAQKSNNL